LADSSAPFDLDPPGPVGHLGGPSRLTRNGGILTGELTGDRVAIWLEHSDGGRTVTIWPGEYRARLEPLQLLDERGAVVARGGDEISVVGGFLPASDPRTSGADPVFFASRIVPGSPR
jgi:hypothetical protein